MGIDKVTLIICSFILSIGILGAGFSVGKSLYLTKKIDRIVSVKGLAENDVKSDLGIWEINYREIGSDLVTLDQRLEHDEQVVTDFLKKQGFTDTEIEKTPIKIDDRLANVFSQTNTTNQADQRYVASAGVNVRSAKVDLIQQSVQVIDKVLQQGVPLAFNLSSQSPNPSFYFTQLDKIRPAMLSMATKSAYTIAAQFAKDSATRLLGVQHASQGVFQIMGRDTSTMAADWNSNQNAMGSIDKKIRLVSTIDYRLK